MHQKNDLKCKHEVTTNGAHILSSYSTLAHDSNETKAEKKGNKFNIEGKKISNNLVINVITFIDKIISTVVNHII